MQRVQDRRGEPVGDGVLDDPGDRRTAATVGEDRTRHPAGDAHQDDQQAQGDQQVVELAVECQPDDLTAVLVEEDPHRSHQGHGLADLDEQQTGERPAPQPGRPVGVRQGQAGQRERRDDDQQDRHGDAEHKGDQ
ncbi:hypothetical protein [Spongiactinospora sp. 9N601]|uniref:hypothetical protein n=1 Tax=Spongiactinospora sp. 9N601 TaxID=3375149 RepID=UPI0037B00DC6